LICIDHHGQVSPHAGRTPFIQRDYRPSTSRSRRVFCPAPNPGDEGWSPARGRAGAPAVHGTWSSSRRRDDVRARHASCPAGNPASGGGGQPAQLRTQPGGHGVPALPVPDSHQHRLGAGTSGLDLCRNPLCRRVVALRLRAMLHRVTQLCDSQVSKLQDVLGQIQGRHVNKCMYSVRMLYKHKERSIKSILHPSCLSMDFFICSPWPFSSALKKKIIIPVNKKSAPSPSHRFRFFQHCISRHMAYSTSLLFVVNITC